MRTIHRAFLLAALTFMWCASPSVFAGTHHLIRFIRPGQLSGFGLEAMQFSPDGSILAVATSDGVVSYVSPESGEKIGTFKHNPFSIGFSKDGSRLLMIGRRSTELMDMIAGIPAKIDNSERNAKGVIGISFNLKDGKLVITTVRPGSPAEKAGTIAVGDELVGVGAGKSGEYQKVVGKSVERTLEMLRGRPGEFVRLKTVSKGTIEDREVLLRRAALRGTEIVPFQESSIEENVVWCISDGSQAFYNAKNGRLLSSFRLSDIENNRGWHAISPDSKHCAFLARRLKPHNKEFAIEVFDIGTRERLAFHRNVEPRNGETWGSVSAFNGFHYSPDGKHLLVGNSWEVQVISVETGKEQRTIETKEVWTRPGSKTTITYRISDFSLSSKGLLAVGFGNGTVRLSDFASGEYLASLPKRDDDDKEVTGIAFSPNGKWLAYYNNDRLHMVDVEEFNPTKALNGKPIDGEQERAPSTLTRQSSTQRVNHSDNVSLDEERSIPQRVHSSKGNNVTVGLDIGDASFLTKTESVKWEAPLHNRIAENSAIQPTVADGHVYVGSTTPDTHMPCLLCLDQQTGRELWSYERPRLEGGMDQDYPRTAMLSTPCVQDNRVYFMTNRCEVVCLNTADGSELWKLDLMRQGVVPRSLTMNSATIVGNLILIGAGNGNQSRGGPSFVAIDKRAGRLVWQHALPRGSIIWGEWSSPTLGTFNGVAQAIFVGGDGWIHSFDLASIDQGRTELLWKFDCNRKDSRGPLGSGSRNLIIGTPVVADGLVYIATGQRIHDGEGEGIVWCVDPTKRGDVSAEVIVESGGKKEVRLNPNSAAKWSFAKHDRDDNGEFDFEETMHRTVSSPVVTNGLVFMPDMAGLVHCIDSKSGEVYWSHDNFAHILSSPLVMGDRLFVGDEDGDVTVYETSKKLRIIRELNFGERVGTMVTDNDHLYIPSASRLVAAAISPN